MRAHMKVLTYLQILTISFLRKTFTGSRAFTLELELKAVIMFDMTVASHQCINLQKNIPKPQKLLKFAKIAKFHKKWPNSQNFQRPQKLVKLQKFVKFCKNYSNSPKFTCDCKILKASVISIKLEKLKLNEAHNCRVSKHQLLKWWKILLPAVFKICHK